MERSVLPFERAEIGGFEGSEALYRDHLGRRVVLDVEGAGFYTAASDLPLQIEIDGVSAEVRAGRFAESLLIATTEAGAVRAEAYLGPDYPAMKTEGRRDGRRAYSGAGWVVKASEGLVVDGRRASVGSFPVPFFREAACEGAMEIEADETIRCEEIDRFSIDDETGLAARGWKVQNISATVRLASSDALGSAFEAPVASHLNRASWRVAIPSDNAGLILRKLYDRFHGRQRARVFVDGQNAGWWYGPEQDRRARWGLSDFGVPEGLTRGKSEIEIAIDPPGGAPLWSVSEYSLFALLPAGG